MMARPLKFPTAAAPQATSGPKAVQFGSKVVQSQPAMPKPVTLPAPQLAPTRPLIPSVPYQPALDLFASRYVTLYAQDRLRVERQLQQLTPLTLSITLDWGLKSLERMRHVATQATALVSAFTSSRCNETLTSCVESLTGAQGGMWAKLTRRLKDTRQMESQLQALRSQLTVWLQQCDHTLPLAKEAHRSLMVKAGTLACVVDSISPIPDNTLEQATSNRRVILQQGVVQSEFTHVSLTDLHQQLVDQAMRIDQVLNITLPAYQAAQSRNS